MLQFDLCYSQNQVIFEGIVDFHNAFAHKICRLTRYKRKIKLENCIMNPNVCVVDDDAALAILIFHWAYHKCGSFRA